MVEMVDTSDLGSDALRDGFESLYPDQLGFRPRFKKTEFIWGMGLLGVDACLASRIAEGFESPILHHSSVLLSGKMPRFEDGDVGSNPTRNN